MISKVFRVLVLMQILVLVAASKDLLIIFSGHIFPRIFIVVFASGVLLTFLGLGLFSVRHLSSVWLSSLAACCALVSTTWYFRLWMLEWAWGWAYVWFLLCPFFICVLAYREGQSEVLDAGFVQK